MDGVTCCTGWIWCCRGEVSGEPLERDERSEAEWMECSWRELSTSCSNGSWVIFKDQGVGGSPITTYIVLGQETGAKLEVVVQIK